MVNTRPTSQSVPWHTYAVLAVGLVAVSLSAVFIRFAQADGFPSLLIAAARLVLSTLVITPIVLYRYRPHLRQLSRTDFLLVSVSGLFLALHFILWISSLENTSVLISVVLVTTTPLWSALFEALFLSQRLTRMMLIGLFITLCGGMLISLPTEGETLFTGANPLLGSLMALGGAVAVAVYLVIGRKVRAKLPLMPYIWLVYGIAALVALAALAVTQTPITGYPAPGYVWLVAIALVPQLIGHSSFNYALEYLSATFVGLISQIEPVASALFAYILFRETPTLLQIAGSLVILSGVITASRNPPSSTESNL